MTLSIRNFVVESMALSFVNDPVSLLSDTASHEKFMLIKSVTSEDLCGFARAIDPKADFVKSPDHIEQLNKVLLNTNLAAATISEADRMTGADQPKLHVTAKIADLKPEQRAWVAYLTYRAYMELKPFVVDAMNGITGRALWLWVMGGKIDKTFLHEFHDQALQFGGVAVVDKQKALN